MLDGERKREVKGEECDVEKTCTGILPRTEVGMDRIKASGVSGRKGLLMYVPGRYCTVRYCNLEKIERKSHLGS